MHWHLIEAINVFVEFLIVYVYFSKILKAKESFSVTSFAAVYIIAGISVFLIDEVTCDMIIKVVFTFVLLVMTANILYKTKFSHTILYSLLFIAILIISEVIFISIMFALGISNPVELEINSYQRIIGMIGTKLLYFWLSIYTSKVINRKWQNTVASHWALILLMPLMSVLILYIILDSLISSDNGYSMAIYAFSVIGLLFLNWSVFDFVESYADKIRLSVLEQVLKHEEQNYALLESSYGELRKLKHDMRNQINAVCRLIENGNKEAAQKAFNATEEQMKLYESVIYSGDALVDTVINLKAKEAEESGIRFSASVVMGSYNINSVELFKVLGNALDNAIEACERISDCNRKISLKIIQKDNKLVITIRNSSEFVNTEKLISSKQDKLAHGIGLKSIKSSVEKMDGIMRYEYENNEFILIIILQNSR